MSFDILFSFLIIGVGAFAAGYHYGVVHTEKRWSDAVARGEWDRKYGSSR